MNTGFNDPIKIRKQEPKDKPVDGKNSPWDFRCPQYDQRSSCYVNAGTKYGVGFNQPVGTFKKDSKNAVPLGRVNTLKVQDESY